MAEAIHVRFDPSSKIFPAETPCVGPSKVHLLRPKRYRNMPSSWEIPPGRRIQQGWGLQWVHPGLADYISRSAGPHLVLLCDESAVGSGWQPLQAVQGLHSIPLGINALSLHCHGAFAAVLGGKRFPGKRKKLLHVFHPPQFHIEKLYTIPRSYKYTVNPYTYGNIRT